MESNIYSLDGGSGGGEGEREKNSLKVEDENVYGKRAICLVICYFFFLSDCGLHLHNTIKQSNSTRSLSFCDVTINISQHFSLVLPELS
jgi:hypothetical protein